MPKKVRVLLLIPHLGGGGAEKVAALLAKGLSKEKYEVHLALITQKDADAHAPAPWVTVHALGARRVRTSALRLIHLMRHLKPDVILSGMAHLNFLVLLLRPLFPRNSRVLVRQNGTVSSALAFGSPPGYTRWLYRFLYPRADRIICQSRAMADDLAAELRIGKERIAVLPNPVDFDGIRAAICSSSPKDTRWSGNGPHLLAVGRLVPEKGFDLLLQALVIVRDRYPDAELIVLGSGPEEPALQALCRSLGLEAAIHFPGYTQRPYDFYSEASLFVLASRHEGMPNALLEAAVAGLPIVATPASGGVVDLLCALEGAWLASETSVAALASALLDALAQLGPAQRFRRSLPQAQASPTDSSNPIGEFASGSAIAAYEQLIDSICARSGPTQSVPSHVALIIPTLDKIGGAERHVMLLAKGLRRRGWRVSVVALSGSGGSSAAELTEAGIAFLSLGMRKGLADPRGWIRFIHWLRRTKPDVVHAHLPHAAWLARWSRLCAPVPALVDTLHSSSTGTVGRRLGYRFSRWLPDKVIAVSRGVAESHLCAGMVNRKSLAILHNGVDVQEWRPDALVRTAARCELGLRDEEFLWIAAGRLDAVKDYPTLLRAMADVEPPAQLVIAGNGPLLESLTDLSTQLGLDRRVRFLGFAPDMKRWLQAADGFVLSSRWEGLPMALLEAAACGLPAVVTNVPGSREVILDNNTGVLVPAANPAALAQAMNTMMRTPHEECCAMGARARQHAVEKFSLTAAIDRYEELYNDLLRRNPNAAHRPITVPDSEYVSAKRSGDVF